jgi:hypothetical protein
LVAAAATLVVWVESAVLAELAVWVESGVLVVSVEWVVPAVLAVSVEWVVLVVPAVLVGSGALAGLGVPAVLATLAGLVVLEASVGSGAEIAYPPCRAGAATTGNTIQRIAAGLLIKTGQPQIASAEPRVAILFPDDNPAPGNKLEGKVATWPVPAEGLELTTEAEPASAIGLGAVIGAEPVRAIGLAEAAPTVSEAVTFRAVAAATEMASEAVPGDTADRALVAAAAAAHPVWDLEAAVAVAAAADGGGRSPSRSQDY